MRKREGHLLLDVFKASADWQTQEFVTSTLQRLQEALFGVFELSEICAALRLLLEREYIFLAPSPDLTKFHAYERIPLFTSLRSITVTILRIRSK